MEKYKYRKRVTIEGKQYDFKASDPVTLGQKIEKKRLELASNERRVTTDMSVSEWFDMFVKTYKNRVTHQERLNIRNQYNNKIEPYIGHLAVKEIKPIDCILIMNQMEGLSKSYASKVRTLLFSMFDAAEENDLTLKNPAKKLKLPNVYEGERRAISDEERKVFSEVCKTHEYGLWLMIMLHCGLRPSETIRVRGIDINLKERTLYIDGTKTKKAKRTVPIPNALIPYLENVNTKSFEPIFQTQMGNPMDKQVMHRRWKALKRAVNIKMGCRVYRNKVQAPYWVADDLVPDCFRHTYGTDLKAKGIPSSIIADMMGHEETSTTAGYTHASNASFEYVKSRI